jgi:hypothetical protein
MEKEIIRPEGVTGNGESTDLLYTSYITGPDGAHYTLVKEDHHTPSDVREAKAWIRANLDPVSIQVVNEKNIILSS